MAFGRATAVRAAAFAGAASWLGISEPARPVLVMPVFRRQIHIDETLLNTGASIPRLGFGTYLANGDELLNALLVAIKIGYRHIDTAAGYVNEGVVSIALATSGVPREQFFLTSKLWCSDHGSQRTQKAIAKSLRRLRTNYLDLFLIHAPDNQGETSDEIRRLRLESWLAMEEVHRAGKLRAIGVSNFEPRHIEALIRNEDGSAREGAIVPAVNQLEVHPHFDQQTTREYCAQRGIAVEAYGSLGADGVLDDPLIKRLAREYRRTPAQIALRHTLQRGTVVLAKSLSSRRIEENARIFEFALSDADCAALDALGSGARAERSYWDNSDVP